LTSAEAELERMCGHTDTTSTAFMFATHIQDVQIRSSGYESGENDTLRTLNNACTFYLSLLFDSISFTLFWLDPQLVLTTF